MLPLGGMEATSFLFCLASWSGCMAHTQSQVRRPFWDNSKQPQLQLGDSQRVVSMAAVVYCLYTFYDSPYKHGHKGVYLQVSLSMLNGNY